MKFDDIDTEVEQYGTFVEGSEYNNGIYATFTTNEIREVEGKFGLQYAFDVLIDGEKRTVATSSKRLLRGLKNNSPLKDKQLFIKREGQGYETYYRVEEV